MMPFLLIGDQDKITQNTAHVGTYRNHIEHTAHYVFHLKKGQWHDHVESALDSQS